MSADKLSRRALMQVGLGAAATAGLVTIPGVTSAHADWNDGPQVNWGHFKDSLDNAYDFLDAMMDAYATGSTVRLIQSYSDQIGLESTAFVYDNALAIMAYLLRGRGDDVARARTLGDGLLYAQTHDPNFSDGRVRQGYFVNAPDGNGAYVQLALFPFYFTGMAVGDMAWSGMALAQLYRFTGDAKYLGTATTGAIGLANFIQTFYDTRGPGGYNYGLGNAWPPNPLTYKSTEHNIDVYAFFTMLARLTGNGSWAAGAQHALAFVKALYNSAGGWFWTGTAPDGASFSTDPKSNIPEDCQTWSYLAMLDKNYQVSIDFAKTNLAVTDTPQAYNSSLTGNVRFNGVSYATWPMRPGLAEVGNPSYCVISQSDPYSPNPDPNAVWLEGSAHLAAALLVRGLSEKKDLDGFHGDMNTAYGLLDNIRASQDLLGAGQTVGGKALPAGQGIQAATSFLNTGFGFSYKPFLHIGATSWYLMAGQMGNPLRLGMHSW
ncbi:MAG TPA: hypothetical protein VKW78_14500 [Terriglobales bacterium]|nr:hypothetical protein [Terriglobales bacterium]